MLLRERLVQAEIAAAKAGIREVGGNNHGPQVKKFLAEVGLPEGYAWCDAFQSYEEHAAAGRRLPIESASVWQTYTTARSLGWLVGMPARGDLVLYDFDGDGRTDDHIGIVRSVSALPGCWKLNTVEGNTGDGSAADGDGVYLRTRVVRRSTVAFVRIPGNAPAKPANGSASGKVKVTVKPAAAAAKRPTLRKGAKGPTVRTLQKLPAAAGASIAVDGVFGPRTLTSVRTFQKRSRLTVDGVVGPKTWAALTTKGAKR
jgi:hypothetical protein